MIIARLKWNTRLYKVDEFVTKFKGNNENKPFDIEVKLTDSECLIYFFKKLNQLYFYGKFNYKKRLKIK